MDYNILPCNSLLNGSWAGVDTVLMNNLTITEKILRPNGPTQLPARDRERLSGTSDCDCAFPHVRKCCHSDHLAAFENLLKRMELNFKIIVICEPPKLKRISRLESDNFYEYNVLNTLDRANSVVN